MYSHIYLHGRRCVYISVGPITQHSMDLPSNGSITVHKLFCKWFYNIQYSGNWDDRNGALLLAHWRLVTLNSLVLVCKQWHTDQMALLDEGVDHPSLIFEWQRQSYKKAALLGQQRFSFAFHVIHPTIALGAMPEMHFLRNCQIADAMIKWRPRRRRTRCVQDYLFSEFYQNGRLTAVTALKGFKYGMHHFLPCMTRSSSYPLVQRDKEGDVRRERSASDDLHSD